MKIHHIFLILCFLPKFEACGESVTSENSCRIQKRETERINRGKNVMLGHHPWLVKIRFSDGATCTGTIVSEKFILTAKHCIKPRAAPKFIFYGHVHTSEMNAIKVKNHSYPGSDIRIKNGHIGTDLALLELVKPLKFSETVGPICLSKTGRMMENETAIIAGFGVAFSSAVFRGKPPSEFVVVPDHNIISFHVAEAQSNCVKHLPDSECKSVQESEFCAGGQNT
uniref:Peptidase S1 domain-containing protein n=1 Tax=Panagrolaimus sp. JU765 TaxID=591449 RepID=A0AC34RPA3_9BILA